MERPRYTFYVHDRGQMCNNILQYGHIYAWARKNGARALSMRFAYKYQYFRICHTRSHTFLTYLLAKTAARLKILPTSDFDLEPQNDEAGMDRLLRRHRRVWIDGWRVHFHDLFLRYRDEICSLFAFLPEVENAAVQRMNPWLHRDDCLLLGLHIRRGDYARFLGGRYFYDDAVMQRLVSQFCHLHPEKKVEVFVCGNDPQLDAEAYRRSVPQAEFVFPNGNPGEDLCVLSHCHYLIGPPSTFSLVASMYHDVPLYWIEQAEAPLMPESFKRFDYLFRQLDTVFR